MDARRLALIVATDHYEHPGLSGLRAPAQDADALSGVLGDPELGGFEVEVLRNRHHYEIAERVEAVMGESLANDLILVHFSCHGLKNTAGELFLAATDTHPSRLASTGIGAAFVYDLMRRSRAQRIVIFLDCCYGGAFERGSLARAGGAIDIGEHFGAGDMREREGGRGRAVVTASNAVEFAFEGAELRTDATARPSIFTGAIAEGLRTGEADIDQDGRVSLGELYEYLFARVKRESPNQTPEKWEYGTQGDLIIARNPRRRIIPSDLPADLVAAVHDASPFMRLGAVGGLSSIASGIDVRQAAAARLELQRLVDEDDSRRVVAAAQQALVESAVKVEPPAVDFGTLERGAQAGPRTIELTGPPLAAVVEVEASLAAIRASRTDRTIALDVDTSATGSLDGMVTVRGVAGVATVRVTGTVVEEAAEAAAPVAPPAPTPPVQPTVEPSLAAASVPPAMPAIAEPSLIAASGPLAAATLAADMAMQSDTRPTPGRAAGAGVRFPSGATSRPILRSVVGWGAGGALLTLTGNWDIIVGGPSASPGWLVAAMMGLLLALPLKIVEHFAARTRIPQGALWGWADHNRLVSAFVEGFVLGELAGLAAVDYGADTATGLILIPLQIAAGFVVAEAMNAVLDF